MELLSKEKIKNLLENRFLKDEICSLKDLPSPFELKDMSKAVERIIKAIKNNEDIVLVGDYDVDGVTSRVIIEDFFEHIGAKIISITPNRFKDGYGLTTSLIKDIKADVIITVDNGITSYDASEYCIKNNIDLIITDHHIASKIPNAFAVINPKQPNCTFSFKEICGAQVAWYLIAGIKKSLNIDYDMSKSLDVLVLAIIADVMPLISMNRVLVKKALQYFKISKRPSIIAIKDALQKNTITSEDIGFSIAPKINVAGRLKDAILAVEFLKSKDINEAVERFAYLSELNMERKQIQNEAFKKSYEIQKKEDNTNSVIVSVDKDFNAGVIGIVASKLVDKCKKIALVGALDIGTGLVKISARSYGGVNLYDLINECKEHLISFGGHKEAAGLSMHISKLDIFTKQINKVFKNNFSFKELDSTFGILDINDVDYELLNILNNYEPFGHKNERPVFLLENVKIAKADKIGKDKKTLKLAIEQGHNCISAIAFDNDIDPKEIENTKVNIKAQVSENIFNKISTIQLMIKEILPKAV